MFVNVDVDFVCVKFFGNKGYVNGVVFFGGLGVVNRVMWVCNVNLVVKYIG